ncbi:acyl carrier protein [Caviibacter abscessus]|uniref:acyl carrier protein n=1 Tax=Caviibacter abscessus TaxID=1766719 RepID=UPI00082F4189|nr:acyl carrier protein [Caviibacter abscessus]
MIEKIKEIIMDQLDVEENEITMESSLVEDLGADSLDIAELMSSFQDEFDVELNPKDVEKIKKIKDLVAYIENHKQG